MWFLRARCSVFQMVVRWYIWYTVICEQDYLPYEGHFTITFNASLETALHWVFVMLQQIYCRLFYLIFMLSLRKDYSFCSYFTCGMNGTRCEEWSGEKARTTEALPLSVKSHLASALNTDQERNQGRISYFRAFWGQQWTERATDSRNTFPLRREALAVRSRTLFMLEHFATVHILPEWQDHMHAWCLQRLEKAITHPEAGIIGGCELTCEC